MIGGFFMDIYSLNINIDEEVKSFNVEDKLNDYIAVQKQVIPILEKENFYGYVKNEATGMEIDIGKKGIKETLGSGTRFHTLPRKFKELKIATLRSIPNMLIKAVLKEDNVQNVHGNGIAYMYYEINVEIQNEIYNVRFDIKKTPQKNKFWIHGVRIIEKNSQLLSPERIKDIYETGNSYNHMIAQKNENASDNSNIAYLSFDVEKFLGQIKEVRIRNAEECGLTEDEFVEKMKEYGLDK